MGLRRARGTILPTAIFVLLCIHALVTVMLASLRQDTALLQGSDRRQEAVLRAQSGIECALDILRGSSGAAWESSYVLDQAPPYQEPPPEAAQVALPDGGSARVWIYDPSGSDPSATNVVRQVWAASQDGRKWQMSSVVTRKRQVHPGLVFGVMNGATDQVYFREGNGSGPWESAPAPQTLDWSTGAPRSPVSPTIIQGDADLEGRFFVVQSEDVGPSNKEHHVLALDTTRGTTGEWGVMPDLPPDFRVDVAGLSVAGDTVYVVGEGSGGREILSHAITNSIRYPAQPLPGGGSPWSTVRALPNALVIDGATYTLPYKTTSLQASEQGSVYLHFALADPEPDGSTRSAFARLKDGTWSFFRPPLQVNSVEPVGGFRPLELDDLGNPLTYAAESGNPAQRGFFRFVSDETVSGLVLKGQWKKLPGISVDDPPLGILRSCSVDGDGRLFMGVRQDLSDPQIFNFHGMKDYPLRSSRHDVPSQWTLPGATDSFQILKAGGQPGSGQTEYVPVNWF